MKKLRLISMLLLLLLLSSCGGALTIIIDFPTAAPDEPTTVITPFATASPTVTTSPTAIFSLMATTTANVNFRNAPNTNNVPLTVVSAGNRVQLTGRISDSTWVRAVYQNNTGWMYRQNLSVEGDVNNLPVVGFTPTATPTIDPTPTRERISYNINGEGVPDTPYLLNVMSHPCKTVALVMNNLSLAVRIKELCPETRVVSRNYSVLEGDEWVLRSPQNRIDEWRREGHPEIIRHSTNEPSFGRGARLQQFVAAECELMRLARAAGFTVAMGNFSVGIYEGSDIQSGFFDPYIRCLNLYGHYLALHEYSCCVLAFGVGQWPVSALLTNNLIDPQYWPTAAQVPVRMIREDGIWQLPSYWYLRRGDWWLLRADAIGVARPQIIVTEFGWDNLPNIKPQIETLRQQFGLDQYFDDMRGPNTYPNLWHFYWPEWSFAQAACQQLLWADSIYPPEYLGFALFTWTNNLPHWGQTDFSGLANPAMRDLHTCLAAA